MERKKADTAHKGHDHHHKDSCGCGSHDHHNDNCGCGGHDHHHKDSCGCGSHDHHHKDSCGCGSHDHHNDSCGCGCGHNHGKEGNIKDWLISLIGLVLMLILAAIPFSDAWRWGEIILYGAVYLLVGHEVLLESLKHIAKGKIFDENFLMAIASLGAFLIGDYQEGIAVMIFYNIGEFCQDAAVRRSKKSVSDLMDIRPDYANLLINGAEHRVSPDKVAVGELILIRPGEKIPLDCVITTGSTTVNTVALTGESLPAECHAGDRLISGCINITGLVTARVERSFAQSTVSRVLAMMEESAGKKTRPERFISRFAGVYTPIVCGIALLTAVIPSLVTGDWLKWIHTALTFLVISCPCALVISVPLSYVGGIGNASRYGILFKGSSAVELLPKLSDLVCDKTGTVTEGKFTVDDILPMQGVKNEELLRLLAAAEQHTTHPIGRSIYETAVSQGISVPRISDSVEISGKGIRAMMDGKQLLAGNTGYIVDSGVTVLEDAPGTVVHLAVDGVYYGWIRLKDKIRPQAQSAFAALRKMGIRTEMLTGDQEEAAKAVCRDLNISGYQAQLLPQDKVTALERIMKKANGHTAFVGDGINDAPVLARADIGIAMGEIGSDAALEAADIVIMRDDLNKLPLAIKLAKQTRSIVYQNILFAIGVKGLIILLGLFGYANMWLAVFADVGVALLAILNAVRPLLFQKKH